MLKLSDNEGFCGCQDVLGHLDRVALVHGPAAIFEFVPLIRTQAGEQQTAQIAAVALYYGEQGYEWLSLASDPVDSV